MSNLMGKIYPILSNSFKTKKPHITAGFENISMPLLI